MSDAVERAQTHPVFAQYVRDLLPTHGEKVDALGDVESLLEHPGWALLERLVNRKLEGLMAGMDAAVQQHAEYIATHSQRFGMRTVVDIPHTIRAIAQESIDHEEAQAGQGG